MSDKKVSKKVTIELTPIQLIWLHSQHEFQRIQEEALKIGHDIKFYKNNTGVELRYQRQPEDKNQDALIKAKQQLVKIVQQNQLRLMRTSLDKDLYVKISREARKQFPRCYIIFLHYETFENCCRKLKQKFSITSITVQLQKLRKQNPYFCFLVAEKNKIDEIQKFTDRLLKSQVSCASTTFSQKQRDKNDDHIPHYRRTMSVSSLKGSYASFNSQKDRNQLDHCRISLQPSETQQQMFQVSEVTLVNLTPAELDRVTKRRTFAGAKVYVQNFEGNYLSMKKKLYYANRFQQCSSPQMQPVFAYSMLEGQANKWRLSLITDRHYEKLSELWNSVWLHSFKMKIELFVYIGKALLSLHRNRQSYGDLRDSNIIVTNERQILLSCIIDKNVPPHVNLTIPQTNPFDYDIRQYLLLIYKAFTQIQLSYDCLVRKIENDSYFCTLSHRCKNKLVKEFLALSDSLFIGELNLENFVKESNQIIKTL